MKEAFLKLINNCNEKGIQELREQEGQYNRGFNKEYGKGTNGDISS